ncbi:hypothetical protein CUMW_059680 [Citrus unshiu]|uniref:F-box domain-containing protein n=1 Tax=Citrus unshiu TaxID=55188 RepID=A0A2H5NMT2_CITUN|nr:hypothetical protein CUMW_059680 [Citrus unshiu]
MAHDTQNNVAKRKRGRPRHNRRYADMISALPDSILCHILSYIPTKHAVATSIIARRWKNVWTAMPNLSFDDRFCQRPPASTYVPLRGFADFVHTVLLRTNPAKIAKFSLYCSRPTNLARFYDWIATALMREVGEIQLYLGQQSHVELLEAIYSAACLKVLRLDSDFSIQVDPYRAIQLLVGINCCKYLHLSASIMSAVDHACDSCFPSFHQLNHIEMGVGPIGWRVLPIVLKSSPNLESLILHKECWFQLTEEQFGWLESESVPHCLVHTVKNIEIKGVQGDEDERPLLKYLFKFASAMETMLMWSKASVPCNEHTFTFKPNSIFSATEEDLQDCSNPYAGDRMSSDVDSEADTDIAYEIVDVPENESYSASEDAWPDDSGDELPTVTGGANQKAPIPSENNAT